LCGGETNPSQTPNLNPMEMDMDPTCPMLSPVEKPETSLTQVWDLPSSQKTRRAEDGRLGDSVGDRWRVVFQAA
ncbi:MAG: hypothetical protein WC789_03690, partial [Lentisphaeria bacterium]